MGDWTEMVARWKEGVESAGDLADAGRKRQWLGPGRMWNRKRVPGLQGSWRGGREPATVVAERASCVALAATRRGEERPGHMRGTTERRAIAYGGLQAPAVVEDGCVWSPKDGGVAGGSVARPCAEDHAQRRGAQSHNARAPDLLRERGERASSAAAASGLSACRWT
jgi:hypothetical protein